MFEKLKGLVGGMGARGAVATDVPDELPRMQFAAIAAKVGMPEEKVAMMAQMVRQNDLPVFLRGRQKPHAVPFGSV